MEGSGENGNNIRESMKEFEEEMMKEIFQANSGSQLEDAIAQQDITQLDEKLSDPSAFLEKSESDPNSSDEDISDEEPYFWEPPRIKRSDIFGFKHEIQTLQDNVITPLKFPDEFIIPEEYQQGILLYGLPGIGKSFLAKYL